MGSRSPFVTITGIGGSLYCVRSKTGALLRGNDCGDRREPVLQRVARPEPCYEGVGRSLATRVWAGGLLRGSGLEVLLRGKSSGVAFHLRLYQNILDDIAIDIGKSFVAALVEIG
jgi:hypothetical protein